MKDPILQVRGITKVFPGIRALDDINLELFQGEVVCIVGENGAGKSTLIKCLAGVYIPDEGEIHIDGKVVQFKSPADAINAGISVVYQEHKLFPNLSVAENIFFGRFPMLPGNLIDYKKLNANTQRILDEIGLNLSPRAAVSSLNSSKSQMVEIAKAYSRGARIMVLDEPSASITESELLKLFEVINKLKSQGKSFIYISHRLKELFEIGDRVYIFKDGKNVGQDLISNTNMERIIKMMVGREIGKSFKPKDRVFGNEILRVEDLSNNVVSHCSFSVREGEIVGFAGLVGSGRSELAESVFGYRRKSSGKIFIEGKEVFIRRPQDAIHHGIGFVTEDRKTTGVILNKSVGMNITYTILDKITKFGWIDFVKEKVLIQHSINKLSIKTPSANEETGNLSGGNQQKIILSKWLLTDSKILICDEPTKGIDVGTKQEFYTILDGLARMGKAVILISSELPEVIGLSNRVYVMRFGKIVAELQENELFEENIAEFSMKD